MGYEIATLVDENGERRGAVFFCNTSDRVLNLEFFTDVDDARAFEKWLEVVFGITDPRPIKPDMLEDMHTVWIKAKDESAHRALEDAVDV